MIKKVPFVNRKNEQMRLKICFCILVILFPFAVGNYFFFPIRATRSIIAHFQHPQTAHVYVDVASWPSFLQSADLVRQPANEPKLVIWNRLKDQLDQALLQQKKASFHTLPIGNCSPQSVRFYRKVLRDFYQKNAAARFEIHLNSYHTCFLNETLKIIPWRSIKRVHIWEDCFAWFLQAENPSRQKPIFLKNDLKRKRAFFHKKWSYNQHFHSLWIAPKTTPVTFHVSLKDKLAASLPHREFYDFIKDSLVETDLKTVSQTLTATQKKELAALFQINPDDYRELAAPQTALFTFGYFDGKSKPNEILIDLLQKLDKKTSYRWFYKEHPWFDPSHFVKNEMAKRLPHIKPLPPALPLEVLGLLGLMPEKVAGFSSSLFFSLPKEKILLYVKRDKDKYLPILLELGLLTKKQVLN